MSNSNTALSLHEGSETQSTVSLIQFWDKTVPEEVAGLIAGVKAANPTLDYVFFDDDSAAEFIRTGFGEDILKLYESCAIPAMRADLFRYCYLVQCGGIYVDADYEAISSIAPAVYADYPGFLHLRESGLANGVMYFKEPNNSLAVEILNEALHNISIKSSNNVWQVTGPSVMQKLHKIERYSALFENFYFMEEAEFALYFKSADCLDYKKDDSHWYVARNKGIDIFHY
jgi:mannosyltransferase OCH1-like enzyme